MRRFLTGLTAILTVVVLIVGCSSSDDTADEPTTATSATIVAPPETVTTVATTTTTTEATTTVAPPEATELRLTFDGETCTYEGPTEPQPGPVELIYVNDSEGEAWVALNRHNGDETIQDAIDHFGPSPSPTPCPYWKTDVARSSAAPGDTYRWEGDLQAATHHLVCYRNPPLEVWFGTGLTVEE
jgi:hypothetical protein